MLRFLTKKTKRERRDANFIKAKGVYAQAASTLPAEYLVRHQEADAATKAKSLARAEERRQRRNAKRLRDHGGNAPERDAETTTVR